MSLELLIYNSFVAYKNKEIWFHYHTDFVEFLDYIWETMENGHVYDNEMNAYDKFVKWFYRR